MKIKLNIKKALLIILALSAGSSQAGWCDLGKFFTFANPNSSKVGVALRTNKAKVAFAAVAACAAVCALAALAWSKYKNWAVSNITQPVSVDKKTSDLSDHVVEALTKPDATGEHINHQGAAEGVVGLTSKAPSNDNRPTPDAKETRVQGSGDSRVLATHRFTGYAFDLKADGENFLMDQITIHKTDSSGALHEIINYKYTGTEININQIESFIIISLPSDRCMTCVLKINGNRIICRTN